MQPSTEQTSQRRPISAATTSTTDMLSLFPEVPDKEMPPMPPLPALPSSPTLATFASTTDLPVPPVPPISPRRHVKSLPPPRRPSPATTIQAIPSIKVPAMPPTPVTPRRQIMSLPPPPTNVPAAAPSRRQIASLPPPPSGPPPSNSLPSPPLTPAHPQRPKSAPAKPQFLLPSPSSPAMPSRPSSLTDPCLHIGRTSMMSHSGRETPVPTPTSGISSSSNVKPAVPSTPAFRDSNSTYTIPSMPLNASTRPSSARLVGTDAGSAAGTVGTTDTGVVGRRSRFGFSIPDSMDHDNFATPSPPVLTVFPSHHALPPPPRSTFSAGSSTHHRDPSPQNSGKRNRRATIAAALRKSISGSSCGFVASLFALRKNKKKGKEAKKEIGAGDVSGGLVGERSRPKRDEEVASDAGSVRGGGRRDGDGDDDKLDLEMSIAQREINGITGGTTDSSQANTTRPNRASDGEGNGDGEGEGKEKYYERSAQPAASSSSPSSSAAVEDWLNKRRRVNSVECTYQHMQTEGNWDEDENTEVLPRRNKQSLTHAGVLRAYQKATLDFALMLRQQMEVSQDPSHDTSQDIYSHDHDTTGAHTPDTTTTSFTHPLTRATSPTTPTTRSSSPSLSSLKSRSTTTTRSISQPFFTPPLRPQSPAHLPPLSSLDTNIDTTSPSPTPHLDPTQQHSSSSSSSSSANLKPRPRSFIPRPTFQSRSSPSLPRPRSDPLLPIPSHPHAPSPIQRRNRQADTHHAKQARHEPRRPSSLDLGASSTSTSLSSSIRSYKHSYTPLNAVVPTAAQSSTSPLSQIQQSQPDKAPPTCIGTSSIKKNPSPSIIVSAAGRQRQVPNFMAPTACSVARAKGGVEADENFF